MVSVGSGALVRIRNLRFRYPGAARDTLVIPALDIGGGGLTALTGPSGVGKSTLVELLAGTLREPYEGTIEVLGVEWKTLNRDADRQRQIRRIGLIPQDFGLLPGKMVTEILERDLADAGVPKAQHHIRIRRALSQVGLSDFAYRETNHLSGGQRQRVAIARMLARDVDLVIADEPTANLDPELVETTLDLFRRLAEHAPVIIVTHDASLAALCDRTVLLQSAVPGEDRTETAIVPPRPRPPRRSNWRLVVVLLAVLVLAALGTAVALGQHGSSSPVVRAATPVPATAIPTVSLAAPVATSVQPVEQPTVPPAPAVSLVGARPEETDIQPGDTITLDYSLDNETGQTQDVFLGATMADDQTQFSDSAHDAVVTAAPGTHLYRRDFSFPLSAAGQTFDLIVSVDDPSLSHTYDQHRYAQVITVESPSAAATVALPATAGSDIIAALQAYHQASRAAYGEGHDKSQIDATMTGTARDAVLCITDGRSDGLVESQAYFTYQELSDHTDPPNIQGDTATVVEHKHEILTVHKSDGTTEDQDNTFDATYTLKRIDGSWLVSDYSYASSTGFTGSATEDAQPCSS
jgi:putative ABC transport system ATP-binding protein